MQCGRLARRGGSGYEAPASRRPPMPITTVGIDADDTLWHNETFYRLSHKRFVELLADFGDEATIAAKLNVVEKRNLRLYGYGAKGFTLSMIETAMELTDGAVSTSVIREILAAG